MNNFLLIMVSFATARGFVGTGLGANKVTL